MIIVTVEKKNYKIEKYFRDLRGAYAYYDRMKEGFPAGLHLVITDCGKTVAEYDTRKGC